MPVYMLKLLQFFQDRIIVRYKYTTRNKIYPILTQGFNGPHVGTRLQRSRIIRITITQLCSEVALAC